MAEYNERDRQELRAQAQVAREAAVETARQMSILWEARLNMAMVSGDPEIVRSVLNESRAQAYMDNCNCGSGGGGSSFLG
jgi:hypothetical protein